MQTMPQYLLQEIKDGIEHCPKGLPATRWLAKSTGNDVKEDGIDPRIKSQLLMQRLEKNVPASPKKRQEVDDSLDSGWGKTPSFASCGFAIWFPS